jgi:hypothetical protein
MYDRLLACRRRLTACGTHWFVIAAADLIRLLVGPSGRILRNYPMLNRPPPYFPQNQLSPPDENRYKKFKLVVAGIILGVLAVLTGLGFGIYYLIAWVF